MKALKSLRDCEKSYNRDSSETESRIQEMQVGERSQDDEEEEDVEDEDEVKSIVFSSDS